MCCSCAICAYFAFFYVFFLIGIFGIPNTGYPMVGTIFPVILNHFSETARNMVFGRPIVQAITWPSHKNVEHINDFLFKFDKISCYKMANNCSNQISTNCIYQAVWKNINLCIKHFWCVCVFFYLWNSIHSIIYIFRFESCLTKKKLHYKRFMAHQMHYMARADSIVINYICFSQFQK